MLHLIQWGFLERTMASGKHYQSFTGRRFIGFPSLRNLPVIRQAICTSSSRFPRDVLHQHIDNVAMIIFYFWLWLHWSGVTVAGEHSIYIRISSRLERGWSQNHCQMLMLPPALLHLPGWPELRISIMDTRNEWVATTPVEHMVETRLRSELRYYAHLI